MAALSTGVAFVVTGVEAPAHAVLPAAEPAPSARDVQEGKERVRERAAEVGRAKTHLAIANGELEGLAVAAATAVERYNGEMVKLERSRQAYQDARTRVAEAERRMEATRSELATFAADAYAVNTGFNTWSTVVSGQGGPQGFMDRAGMMEVLARRRAGIMQRVEAARNVAAMFRRQAQDALDAQRAATRRASEAKRDAEQAVETQRSAVKRIEERKRGFEQSLGRARTEATRLERRREMALERAARREFKGSGRVPARLLAGAGRGNLVVRAALKWLGTPYSWGGGNASGPSYGIAHGSGIHGFDCSGLALYAWSKVGVRLDHWTGTQWTSGPHIPLNRLRAGDLVFFANNTSDPDTIHHVGIYISKGRMVEAPYTGARVRISSIWRNGLIGATRPAG